MSADIWEFLSLYEYIDRMRRWQGSVLDVVGLGPVETPSRIVTSSSGLSLRAYGDKVNGGPVLLIIPAPIKRAYIWDLIPRVSVVRRCRQSGLRVYMIDWEKRGSDGSGGGLDKYADEFILECLDAIKTETGERRTCLAGHSLGGTFAAIFTALHPKRVRGLVLAGAPTHFGPGAGDLNVPAIGRELPPIPAVGRIPGSYLSMAGYLASPTTFGVERWVDWINSSLDPQAFRTHLLVQRWTLDETPMSGQLFRDIVKLLYRENRFMRGTLMVGGHRAAPDRVKVPTLSIIETRSRIVPPQAMLPLQDAVRNDNKRLLRYEGDTGVALQHTGMLVGKTAHQYIWPEVIRWIHALGA